MNYYRISKYNPQYRIDGIYRKDEWTAMSDIGKIYDGQMFTEDDYLQVEKSYVDFILDVYRIQNIELLKVEDLENHNKLYWKNGQKLNADQSGDFIRACLREKCWGRLVAEKFIFETGYEYYIHIGCDTSLETMKNLARQYNLFVEIWEEIK